MNKTIRTIDAYYEATGPYAFTRSHAEDIYGRATELVSRYTGPVVLSSLRGANVPLGDRPLTSTNVRLGNAPHSALLSARPLIVAGHQVSGNARVNYRTLNGKIDQTAGIISSSLQISDAGRQGDTNLTGTAIHEIAHSFIGLDHCVDTSCIMQATSDNKRDDKIMAQPDPFCDGCIGDLEIAGYQALAAQL